MPYATIAAVKRALRKTDTDRDDDLTTIVATADAAIVAHCGRDFGPPSLATNRARVPVGDGLVLNLGGDVADIGSVRVTGRGLDWTVGVELVAERSVLPVTRGVTLRGPSITWAQIADVDGLVDVTAEFGWPDVPAPVVTAAILLSARLFKRSDSDGGLLGMVATGGEAVYIRSIDPDIGALLLPYSGPRRAAL